ncbi:MAG: ATPase domain-containing protein [Chloroflexota bacterium]|nr:ATPase domain-containing protein [Chloroflexota bacterium]
MSLAKIQEPPDKGLILLTGAPGAGKSTFCHQVVVKSMALDRPVIFVTSERSPADVLELLSERGMGEALRLNFVDAFTETVGLTCIQRSDTEYANCADLNSMSIAITKLQDRTGQKGSFLVFDSLTSPYLFSGVEVVKFMRLFLSKFASEGNSALALMDEGCGKEEDLGAMMSVADGILRMEIRNSSRIINVVKHPKVTPTRIEVPRELERIELSLPMRYHDPSMQRKFSRAMMRGGEAGLRKEVGDFVNLFWPNLAHWSGMLWDPKRFPTTTYELNKEDPRSAMRERLVLFPLYARLFMKLLIPKNFSKVKDMKKAAKQGMPYIKTAHWERSGIVEYLEDVSKIDEHYFRVYESTDCWGLENVGATVGSHLPPLFAGVCKGFEKEEREWNAIETKCIGLGDPYCEFKLVPGEIHELRSSLEKDVSVIEKIHDRLMDRLMGFLLHGKPLVERPRQGSEIQLHAAWHAMGVHPPAGDRYGMALRMGGARSGKEVGERLMDAGLKEDEAIKRVIDFMNYCKVGKVTLGETIRIKENCESSWTRLFTTGRVEPSCFFTTGFLNGLFSAVKNQHVREIKCIAAGDPYCEWEII